MITLNSLTDRVSRVGQPPSAGKATQKPKIGSRGRLPHTACALRTVGGGLAAIFIGLMLGGCTLASKYHRPDYPLPETYRGAQAATDSFGDVEWWEVFQDPQLQELIRKGLENNYDLRIATARVVEARAGLASTRAGLFPALTSAGSATRSDTYQIGSTELTQEPGWKIAREDGRFKLVRTPGGPDNEAERDSANATLDLSWEVDLWGRVRGASEAARADFVATEAGRAAVVSRW